MNVRSRYWIAQLLGLACIIAAGNVFAACPGDSAYASVKSLVLSTGGSATDIYIEVDASTGSPVDVCGCRTAGNVLYLTILENPVTEGGKLSLALAMEAKALNKRVKYYGTGCYQGSASGKASFSSITIEP